MEYKALAEELENGIVKISVTGFLDAHTAPDFEELLKSKIQEGKVKIIVDMEELDYISSTGLGVFMGYIEEIREKGGDIKFINIPNKIYRIFSVLGFTSIYEIYDKLQDAIKEF